MIIKAIIQRIINIVGWLFGSIISIPVFNDISNVLSPYLNALTDYIIMGARFISFFIPMELIQTLLPVILAMETALFALDIVKFILKIIGSLK